MTRVLTVDDSKSMRKMIRFTLENAGIEVIEKNDGDEALEWAKQNNTPDLILADINMPNMDGITLVKNLRSLSQYRKTPILILTTDSSSEKKDEGKLSGATGWVVKPFSPDHLVDTIFKVLNSNKPRE